METAQLLLRGAGGLLAVLGTLWVCVRVVRARAGALGAAPAVRLRVLARAPLGRHTSVVTVDAGDRVLVLGVGEHGVRLLAEQPALPAPVTTAPTERVELDLGPAPAVEDAAPDAVRAAAPDAAQVVGPAAAVLPVPPGLVPGPRSAVSGSIVDPAVWRTVVTLARDKTVRR